MLEPEIETRTMITRLAASTCLEWSRFLRVVVPWWYPIIGLLALWRLYTS